MALLEEELVSLVLRELQVQQELLVQQVQPERRAPRVALEQQALLEQPERRAPRAALEQPEPLVLQAPLVRLAQPVQQALLVLPALVARPQIASTAT